MSYRGPRKCKALRPRRAGQIAEPDRCGNPIRQSGGRGPIRKTCSEGCEIRWRRERAIKAAEDAASVQWYTPIDVFRWFEERWGPFTVDPCAAKLSPTSTLIPVRLRLDEGRDGLDDSWDTRAAVPGVEPRAFVNPPYGPGRGPLRDWTDRAYQAVVDREVELAAMLVPLRPTSGWRKLAKSRGAVFEPYDVERVKFLELDPDAGTVEVASGALFECEAVVFSVARVTVDSATQ